MVGICPVNVAANEVQTKYLKVSLNDKVQTYECLWDAKEIFCSIEDLGEITNYDWTQMEDGLEFQFYREYENDNGDYGIELQTSVLVEVDDNKKTAEIDAMGESYSVNCYVKDEEVFLPLEKLLYLLHAEWTIDDNVLCVVPMSLTILDFMAIHSIDLAQIESTSEDVLIDTGWLFSDNEWGQAVYSAIAEVFSDFDGKIFMLWWPGEGHVETAECYENAILQLAKEDEEFIGEDVQSDAMEVIVDSIFSINSESTNKIQNIISVPSNIDDFVQSVPDAVSVLEDLSETFPNIEVSQKVKNVSEKIKNGQIDSSFLEIPEMKSKADELGKIGDGLAILQCVWNAYDVANRVEGWNEEYLSQLDVLANYNNPGSINENVVDYVQSSAQHLIDSYNNPTQAVTDEALQSTMGLLLSKTFEESPFGKVFSIMGAVGTCYGTFDVETAETYDVYSELSVVTFSIKIEQLVRELFRYEDILTTTEKLTSESIEEARDQLMLYLRLNLRNKAQLYNLNLRGNENKNWSETEEAKKLYDEIVKVYAMLAELIETKDCDSRIILVDNLDEIYSLRPAIPQEILSDEKTNVSEIEVNVDYEYVKEQFLSNFHLETKGEGKTAYLSFWVNYGASASVEDFIFAWNDEQTQYELQGNRSGKTFDVIIEQASEDIIKIDVICHEKYFNWITGDEDIVWSSAEYQRKKMEDKEKTEEELKAVLEECSSDLIVNFEYDDYDGDGINEAYGFTSPNEYDEWGLCSNVDVWFIDSSGSCILRLEDTYGYLHKEKLVAENRKFLVWERSAGGSGSLSFIFGVREGEAYEPNISGEYMCFGFDINTGACNREVFNGYTSDFSKGYHDYIPTEFEFDVDSGEFIEK